MQIAMSATTELCERTILYARPLPANRAIQTIPITSPCGANAC